MTQQEKKGNPFYLIALIIAIIGTVIVGGILLFYGSIFENDENGLSENKKVHHANLWLVDQVVPRGSNDVYVIAGFEGAEPESEKIAFYMKKTNMDTEMFSSAGRYPEIYWEGAPEVVDLSENFLYGDKYGSIKDPEGNDIYDISEIEDQVLYSSIDGIGLYGEKIRSEYEKYSRMKVYKKAIIGYVDSENSGNGFKVAMLIVNAKILPIMIPIVILCIIFIVCGKRYENRFDDNDV